LLVNRVVLKGGAETFVARLIGEPKEFTSRLFFMQMVQGNALLKQNELICARFTVLGARHTYSSAFPGSLYHSGQIVYSSPAALKPVFQYLHAQKFPYLRS
jgi:hypothetical protein